MCEPVLLFKETGYVLKIIVVFLFVLFLGGCSSPGKDEGCIGCSIISGAVGLLIVILC